MEAVRHLSVCKLSLLRLHRLSRVRWLQAGGRQRADDGVDGIMVHQDTAAGRRHIRGEVVLRRREDSRQPCALAHPYPGLLRLVSSEDVLEAMYVEEQVDRLLPEAGAPSRRHAEARFVKLVVLFLFGQGRIRPKHLVHYFVGLD
eukprot:767436-Hanusia_phi.AAC.10